MVNVNDRIRFTKGISDDLHIACQHDQINIIFFQKSQFLRFDSFFGILCHLEDMKGDVKRIGNVLQVRMIRQDESNFTVEFAGAVVV